jgi:opacity protein-like surface antigen
MMLRLVVALAAAVPSVAAAQAWVVQSGAAARGEFNDNYFFSTSDQQSAFTATVAPFVTAVRQTETSDATAFLAVGLNRVWGPSPTTDYVSGRLGLNGAAYDERSVWAGAITLSRAPLLQLAQTQAGTTLVRANTNAANVNGAYSYTLAERWWIGAVAGWYQNDYDTVEGAQGTLSDNRGYLAGATLDHRYSDRTGFKAATMFSNYISDITRSNVVTTTLGVAHQVSPQLTLSASVGGFWSETESEETAFACPAAPVLCRTGLVQPVLVSSGDRRRDSGPLYGGGISYDFTEGTRLAVTLSQSIDPSGTGTIVKNTDAAAAFSHRFSERVTGRLGISYTRTKLPTALSGSFANDYYAGEVGASFQLAEHWILEAGYRYVRAEYEDDPFRPASNVVFVSIAYNWPAGSFTDWVGTRFGVADRRLGAGPISLPERRPVPARLESPTARPESLPFGTFTIP